MAKINLLPWREEYRQVKKREFLEVAAVVLVAGLLAVFAWDRVVDARIDNQASRNDRINQEIAELDKQVKEISELKTRKQEMLDRMEVIQALQANRPDIVRIFDELVKATPEGVFLTDLERVNDAMSLTGFAESNNRVSALMRNLDGSYKFTDPNLTKVEADQSLGEQGNRFEMRVQLTKPEVVVEQDNTGA
ncbi:MAG: PilN domain-containing protein [Porticoccaceae bacterium]|jgi:type IV pilus assembly protein PilN|nr:PilN domain-containing protein [Porticoccaceae bacterium]MEA3299566.1 PilN domain-containing protein [Pseudomonadota bacterium]HLS97130.1 PilN domain-containing protein [Porticoccaceae bacterium]